ncbi:MAG TPA: ATP-binding cassette domain-containing protein [Vicinamibacterales bacterium]|nr:ATP-binding cassette domain-containing protein [Vicinamibacterales bacterium]
MTQDFPPSEIVLRDVHLTRGATPVLRGLSLQVERGETLVLVGRSGAGKSSVLKLINRLLNPDRGDVMVCGRSAALWDPIVLRRQIGYVLQEVGLFPHLSVRDNVGIVPRLLGWADDRVRARVDEVLDLVELPAQEYAARPPHELSGGQRQRVGVARALAADPPLLLMDEPFGALDPVTRSELHTAFRRIQSRVRKTVVLVTHDMAEALALASRVGVLADGQIIVFDDPPAILRTSDARVRPLLAPLLEAGAALRVT